VIPERIIFVSRGITVYGNCEDRTEGRLAGRPDTGLRPGVRSKERTVHELLPCSNGTDAATGRMRHQFEPILWIEAHRTWRSVGRNCDRLRRSLKRAGVVGLKRP